MTKTWWFLACLAGCTTSEAAPKLVDPCSPEALKLPGATRLAAWKPPEGCEERPGGGKVVLRTQAEVDTSLDCAKGKTLGVDLKKQSIVRVSWNMSPAAIGLDVLDDKHQLTVVTRFRNNCPKDPRPMPMTVTKWYLMPAGGAERTFDQATCTVPTKCP